MKSSNFVYPLIVSLSLLFTVAQAQQTFHTTPTTVIGYLEYLPQDYANNSDQYPVVIFLHGLGERGSTSTDPVEIEKTIAAVKKNGPPKHVNNGVQFPFILISPQLKSNLGNWPSAYVNEVIEYCKTYLRIDERRIYLTGLSLGGGGTWWTAQDFPKTFAAIAPVCGSRNTTSMACGLAAENLPVWAFHGDADGTVPFSRSVNMVNAINACTPAPNPLAKITIYPGIGHNSWDKAYMPDHTIHNPNVYDWLLSFTNTLNGGNAIPLTNVGADLNVTTTSVVLNGSASDSDGTISSYLWSQLKGPSAATLANTTTNNLTVSNMVEGVYVFKLKATDNSGNANSDYVTVTVLPKPANLSPTANAGADASITLPANAATLVGTGTDTDGTIASYLWTMVSGTSATMSGSSTNTLNVTALTEGTYVFRLAVTDNLGATQTDDATVTVLAGSSNVAPVVNAGADKIVKLPSTTIIMAATASDADGSIASYNWTKVSGGSCTLASTTVLKAKVSNLVNGTYVFRLTVTDNAGAVTWDDVTFVASNPPVVNAGDDYTISLPASTVTLSGSATDSDGSVTTYLWGKYSGPTVVLIDKSAPTTNAVKLLEGTYVFRLRVTDDTGVQSEDFVTVTVLPEVVQAASTTGRVASLNAEPEPQATQADESSSSFVLSSDNISSENCPIVVYNGNGEVLYNGIWKADLYSEIFNHSGLYIYKVIKNGKRLTGKLYVTQ